MRFQAEKEIQEATINIQTNEIQESILKWLRQKQEQISWLKDAPVELLEEFPNKTINVCPDGPKILVLPNATDIVYCYTQDQWIDKLWSDLRLRPFHYPIIILNFLIFLFGTTGNIFVCLSVYRNHQLRNVTNYFIVNLAFADLLVIIICLPATVVWDLSLTWFFGTIPCKLIMFLQDVSISVSVLTLAAISIDRYYAICHPLKFKSNLNQAKRMIALIWLISLILMLPDVIFLGATRADELADAGLDTVLYSDCNYNWSQSSSRFFQFVKTILLYLLPFILMFCAHFKIMRTLQRASSIEKQQQQQQNHYGILDDGFIVGLENDVIKKGLDSPVTNNQTINRQVFVELNQPAEGQFDDSNISNASTNQIDHINRAELIEEQKSKKILDVQVSSSSSSSREQANSDGSVFDGSKFPGRVEQTRVNNFNSKQIHKNPSKTRPIYSSVLMNSSNNKSESVSLKQIRFNDDIDQSSQLMDSTKNDFSPGGSRSIENMVNGKNRRRDDKDLFSIKIDKKNLSQVVNKVDENINSNKLQERETGTTIKTANQTCSNLKLLKRNKGSNGFYTNKQSNIQFIDSSGQSTPIVENSSQILHNSILNSDLSTECNTPIVYFNSSSENNNNEEAKTKRKEFLNKKTRDTNSFNSELAGYTETFSLTGSMKDQDNLKVTMHNKTKLESRRKAAKMLMAIVIMFGICYLPVHLINFLRQFIDDIPQTDITSTISMLAHSFCYLNSAINPIIYNHMNSIFRAEFSKFLSCFHWRFFQHRASPHKLPPDVTAQKSPPNHHTGSPSNDFNFKRCNTNPIIDKNNNKTKATQKQSAVLANQLLMKLEIDSTKVTSSVLAKKHQPPTNHQEHL